MRTPARSMRPANALSPRKTFRAPAQSSFLHVFEAAGVSRPIRSHTLWHTLHAVVISKLQIVQVGGRAELGKSRALPSAVLDESGEDRLGSGFFVSFASPLKELDIIRPRSYLLVFRE